MIINSEWLQNNGNYKCPFCNKEFSKKGIATHVWRSHTNDGKKHNPNIGYKTGTKIIWNKGLTKFTDERVKKSSETFVKKVNNGEIIPSFKNKHHSKETKELISKKLSCNNHGGKCKWFLYIKKDNTEFKLQGTWEVRFAKILDIIDENWIKIGVGNKEHSFIWEDENKNKHYYTPDFYSSKLNKYFEIKGYWWGDDKNKIKQVIEQNKHIKIEIITKKELLEYEKLIN
jgi:ribosomal protein L37AE/L43A